MTKQSKSGEKNLLQAIRDRAFPRFLRILDEGFKGAAATAARHTKVHKRAAEVLGGDQEARTWLHQPAVALNLQRPADLLHSDVSAKQVLNLLDCMEHELQT